MDQQMQGPIVPPEMLRKRAKKSWLMPALGGLVAGTVLGLVIGISVPSGVAGNAKALSQKVIDQAVENCGIEAEGYTVLDAGAAIELDTKGEDLLDGGTTDWTASSCMLTELGVPESTQQKISRTRALDGTQTDSWGSLQATWTYHPDNGSSVLIEEGDQ
ncbi:hypothetical protein [Glutamicibacter sp. AOP5-A2-18]|uniref:hypothetical protein n=1 Tax=Glutamicibacter sp. AOP5-A2-18 TaxID=3457656 RepID=UPI004033EB2E